MNNFYFIIDMRMSVRYNYITNKCSEDENMEPKIDFLTTIKDNYQIARSRPDFIVFPQMPVNQIQHYIKQAARKELAVVIQLNPSPHNKQMNEAVGKLSLSPSSSHVILKTFDEQMVHLIQPQHIRHLRLA